jgi:hypothetical protein
MDTDIESQIGAIAQQYGVPTPILTALYDHPGGMDVPPSVAKAYGFQGAVDLPVKTALTARVLSDAFRKHQSWESALSVLRGGTPHDWQTHDHVGGFVDAVLGVAAVRSTGQPEPKFGQSIQRLSQGDGVVKPSRQPDGPHQETVDPREVETFAQTGMGLGLDPGVIAQGFSHAATLRQRLLGKDTTLEDFAEVHGLDAGSMLDYYRAQPHPTYPEMTAGDFHDMGLKASLFSLKHQNRAPFPSEVARLHALGAGPQQLEDHFSADAVTRTPVEKPMQVIQGGQAGANP